MNENFYKQPSDESSTGHSKTTHRRKNPGKIISDNSYFVLKHADSTKNNLALTIMKKMAESMEELLTVDGDNLDFQKITDIFLSFSEAKYAVFNLFDEFGDTFSTVAVSGCKEIIDNTESLLGFRVDGKRWDADPVRDSKIKVHTINRFANLEELVGDIIPNSKISLVTKTLKLGEVILIKISRKNIMLGDLTLFMPEGRKFDKDDLAIIFARQLSLAITHKRAEKTLLENEKAINRHNSLLSSLLKNLPIGVFMVEVPNGKPLVANRMAMALLGRGILPEANSDGLQDVYNIYKKGGNDPYPTQEMPIILGMEGKTSYINDMIVERPDGVQTQLEVYGTPVADENGQIWASLISFCDITDRINAEDTLKESETKYRSIFTVENDSLFVVNKETARILEVNDSACNLYGYSHSELLELTSADISAQPEETMNAIHSIKDKSIMIPLRYHKKKDGTIFPVEISASTFMLRDQQVALIAIRDITERIKLETDLSNEKNLMETTLFSVGDGVISTDKKGNITFLNRVAENLTGWMQDEAKGKSIGEVFNIYNEGTGIKSENIVDKVLGSRMIHELINNTLLIARDGSEIPIEDSAAPIMKKSGEVMGVVLVFRDFSEKKKRQEEIEFLSFHDQLTNLYNRRYFDNALKRLSSNKYSPVSLVMADVNGLKLTNDAFGHQAGDILLEKTAAILKSVCRSVDIVARIGGDEFVLLLPNTDAKNAERVIRRINHAIETTKVDNVILSLSIGYAVKVEHEDDMNDVFKKAEDEMYRHKLSESMSMRSKTIDVIMNTLFEKNNREMLHSKRVSEICEAIAIKMDFDQNDINQIKLAGLMHDIGKIGIPETILNNPKKLSHDDLFEIQRHSEIGYRILSSVNEFSEIADYVLEHQEQWDGKGYPRGLEGEQISLQARIIAIADAYDAMTSERTYHKAASEDEAASEVRKYSGTQFDPTVSRVFIEKVLKKKWKNV